MSAFGNDGDITSSPFSTPGKPLQPQASASHGLQDLSAPKRRGRPPKAVIAARELAFKSAAESHAATTLPGQSLSHSIPSSPRPHKRKDILLLNSGKRTVKSTATRHTTKVKDKDTTVKKSIASTKRRRVVLSESSDLSDVENHCDDDDDAQSVQFPTFVSASTMSCTSSNDSDIASLSGFDTDSSVEAEEENFILAEESRAHDKARVRRELLGEEGGQKRRDPHNNWVIRPRKMSVGPSDVEMDVDSEATEEEDEEEEEEEGDADEEETDDRDNGVGYVGVATGWSEDDESSFDADLFFANLSDSEGDNASSAFGDEGGDDGDQSDLETMSVADATTADLIPRLLQDMENLPFEITQGWDGQVVFTNGLREGQGTLDMDFEVNAAQFVVETSASPSQDSDVDMFASDADEDGYAEDGDEGSGETTDEELVGEDDLPNERAMQIFNLPFSVSAINPMSTMSPSVSPHSRNRRTFGSQSYLDSPKPADILAGKIFWEDSDDPDECDDNMSKTCSISSSRDGLPRQGNFEPAGDSLRAIIDDSHTDIPSAHPRFRRGRGKSASHFGRYDGVCSPSFVSRLPCLTFDPQVDHFLRRRVLSRHSSLPASNRSSFQLLSSEETGTTSPKLPPAEPIELDDVLDASFLDSDPSDVQGLSTSTSNEGDSRNHLKNLSRWDLISVGAFRQTRETAGISDNSAPGWGSDTPGAPAEYGSMMKSSPLSTMLWQNKSSSPPKRSRNMSVVISPVLPPLREHDGDRTPTNAPPNQIPPQQQNHHYPHKTRKELRRERKLKRKSYSSVQHQHQHHQYHYHQHHPNSKTRSSSSSQRTNFFNTSSSVPALNL